MGDLIEQSEKIRLNNEFQECIMPIINFCNKHGIENPNEIISSLKIFFNNYENSKKIHSWYAECDILNAL